ncbi:MAG: diphthamide biosynthesis enzyme Dph2 [Candidatus Marsarchaeota archaeon]|jgi:2-(3-amino-3-carboxypropyl)histidine synthase|nr:diphthamide biosynthesis enzyme Dph2 [Candidatus Marsarchaeota archaeon]MCL5430817.1 diphthamide biosynthesis enzyme Dph2 [Candidatus Marsarchaeota archaeon]
MRILIQFPEGLKDRALHHAKMLESEGNDVLISASPTFGACDLALDEARDLKADKLIHFGHAEFHKVDFNVEYIPYEIDAPLGILEDSLPYMKDFRTIGLVTTVQHLHQLKSVKEFFESHGKEVLIGKPYGFAKHPGQILGCDIGSSASVDRLVDAHVYFGGGIFHPLGAVLNTKKPFIAIEPFQGSVERMDHYREEYRKKRNGKLLSSIDAKKVGILVTTKNGQSNMPMAELIKRKVESQGMEAGILVANTFDFDSINNMMEFDVLVNTACPRIAVDDTDRTRKPLLSANELMELLRMKKELEAMHNAKA